MIVRVIDYQADLIRFVPDFLREISELKAIYSTENPEINALYEVIELVFDDKLIMHCSAERVAQWEKALNIVPQGTLEERRYYIKGVLNGVGKLNEAKIKEVVRSFTGGESIVTFSDSTINIRVQPPNNGEQFRFPDVERALKPRVPAHLGLNVERYYSTWKDIKNGFGSWNAVKEQLSNWNAVKNWITQ